MQRRSKPKIQGGGGEGEAFSLKLACFFLLKPNWKHKTMGEQRLSSFDIEDKRVDVLILPV